MQQDFPLHYASRGPTPVSRRIEVLSAGGGPFLSSLGASVGTGGTYVGMLTFCCSSTAGGVKAGTGEAGTAGGVIGTGATAVEGG